MRDICSQSKASLPSHTDGGDALSAGIGKGQEKREQH